MREILDCEKALKLVTKLIKNTPLTLKEVKKENYELRKDMLKMKRYISTREFIHIAAIFKKWGIE